MKELVYMAGILILFMGCSNSSTGIENESKEEEQISYKEIEFIPTEIGRYWIMKGDFEADTSYISKDTTIDGNKFYVISEPDFVYEGFTVTTKKYFTYSDSGMVMGRVENGNLEDQILYKYPKEDGSYQDNSYEQYLRNEEDDTYNVYTYPSPDSTISTPAGTFDTFVFFNRVEKKYSGELHNRFSYSFKEAVGFVREKHQPADSYVTTSKLIETGNVSELPNFPKQN